MIDKTRCDSGGGAAKSKGCTERRFSLFIKEEIITALGQYLDQMLHKKKSTFYQQSSSVRKNVFPQAWVSL